MKDHESRSADAASVGEEVRVFYECHPYPPPNRQPGKRSATLAGPTKAPGGLSSVLAFQTLSGRPAARVTGVDCWMPLMGTVVLGMSWNERYHPHRKSHTSRWRVLSLNGSGGMTRWCSMRRTELTRRNGAVRRAANPARLRCNRRVGYLTAENAASSDEGINDETNSDLCVLRASAVHDPKFAHAA